MGVERGTDFVEVENGQWFVNALRLKPRGVPMFVYPLGTGRKHFIAQIDQKTVAVIRWIGGGANCWIVRVEGFMWRVTPDMPTSRFSAIKFTPVKGFKRKDDARAEVVRILTEMPPAPTIAS